MISLECKTCPTSGWCEYDLSTDTIYPAEPENCPLMKKEEK